MPEGRRKGLEGRLPSRERDHPLRIAVRAGTLEQAAAQHRTVQRHLEGPGASGLHQDARLQVRTHAALPHRALRGAQPADHRRRAADERGGPGLERAGLREAVRGFPAAPHRSRLRTDLRGQRVKRHDPGLSARIRRCPRPRPDHLQRGKPRLRRRQQRRHRSRARPLRLPFEQRHGRDRRLAGSAGCGLRSRPFGRPGRPGDQQHHGGTAAARSGL